MKSHCPGSSHLTNPLPEDIVCPHCLFCNEIWSDESKIQCKRCGSSICREVSLDCLKWCKHAVECVGIERYKLLVNK